MSEPILSAKLFVGSKTKRTMIEWLKVFKIVDNKSLIEEIKTNIGCNEPYGENDHFLLIDFLDKLDLSSHIEKLDDILGRILNLKFAIDYSDQTEKFYIGRTIKNVQEDISSDIWFWNQYNIEDIDIFSAMYNEQGGLKYTIKL